MYVLQWKNKSVITWFEWILLVLRVETCQKIFFVGTRQSSILVYKFWLVSLSCTCYVTCTALRSWFTSYRWIERWVLFWRQISIRKQSWIIHDSKLVKTNRAFFWYHFQGNTRKSVEHRSNKKLESKKDETTLSQVKTELQKNSDTIKSQFLQTAFIKCLFSMLFPWSRHKLV